MSKKIIEFNASLSGNNKTRSNRSGVGEKKPKAKPMITPNSLKAKFLEKIKEHKRKETNDKKEFTSSLSKDDEVMDSINFLSSLAKQQQQQKTKPAMVVSTKPLVSHTQTMKSRTSSDATFSIPHVELDLPDDLKELQTATVSVSHLPNTSIPIMPTIRYSIDNAVPYGCLKGGVKPTYKSWTYKNRGPANEPSPIQYSNVTIDTSVVDRENKLNSLKEKMRQKQQDHVQQQLYTNYIQSQKSNNEQHRVMQPIMMDISSTHNKCIDVEEESSNISVDNSTSNENPNLNPNPNPNVTVPMSNLIKKTIKRKVTVGKSKTHPKIGVLIKDRDTRKRILHAQKDLKKKPLNDVKKYLRDHGLMKVGSNAPTDVIRKMYESSMLTGDIMNNNKEILLHNFTKSED
jgi:hypothetical protein